MNDNNDDDSIIINNLFPIPVYQTRRDSGLDSTEEKEIEDIIEEGMIKNLNRSYSNNSYIFDTRLYNLKEFCEQHIKTYVKKIINPTEELDFYITQSWLNVTKPGGSHQIHSHTNSIISGAFYIQTDVGQTITCYDTHKNNQPIIDLEVKELNLWNSNVFDFGVTNNQLLLFPSWLDHGVQQNEKQTKDVISLSFNTFAKGIFGKRENLNQLIL